MLGARPASRLTVFATVLLGFTANAAATPPPEPAGLTPSPVVVDAPEAEGPQFLAADRKGRLYLARGGRPAFYTVEPDGTAAPWGDPEAHRQAFDFRDPFFLDAALSPDGSRWVILYPTQPYRVTAQEAEPLAETPWQVGAVADPGSPVAAALPVPHSARPATGKPTESDPPLLIELSGQKWVSLHDEALSEVERADPDARVKPWRAENLFRVHRALHLAPASPSGLWAANNHLYRLRRFSPAGRLLTDLTLSDQPEPIEQDEAEIEELRAVLEEQAELHGFKSDGRDEVVVRPLTSRSVIRDVTEDRSGRVFLYVAPGVCGPHPCLDRFDPVRRTLERIELPLDDPGRISLAAGRDGLWIAAVAGDHQFWTIPWNELETAGWQPVEGLLVDGLAP